MGTFRLGDAMIEAQEFCGRMHPSLAHNLSAGPIFDYNLHVVEFVQEDVRQGIQCLGNKLFKQVTFH